MSYYFNRKVELSFEEAIERVTEELMEDGFGMDENMIKVLYWDGQTGDHHCIQFK